MFYLGAVVIIFLELIFLQLLPPEDKTDDDPLDWEELAGNFPCFRFVMMIILAIVMIGNNMRLLTKYKVNYSFIFELDPRFKITQIEIFRVSLLLLTAIFRWH